MDFEVLKGDFLISEQFQQIQKIILNDKEIGITNEFSGRFLKTQKVKLDFQHLKKAVSIQASFEIL